MHLENDISDKGDVESSHNHVGTDHAEHVHVSEADDKRLCRKTDLNLLPVLIWVYILQILDKQVRLIYYETTAINKRRAPVPAIAKLTLHLHAIPTGHLVLCRFWIEAKC